MPGIQYSEEESLHPMNRIALAFCLVAALAGPRTGADARSASRSRHNRARAPQAHPPTPDLDPMSQILADSPMMKRLTPVESGQDSVCHAIGTDDCMTEHRVGEEGVLREALGLGQAGIDRVDGDPPIGELRPNRAGERDLRVLRSRVRPA